MSKQSEVLLMECSNHHFQSDLFSYLKCIFAPNLFFIIMSHSISWKFPRIARTEWLYTYM